MTLALRFIAQRVRLLGERGKWFEPWKGVIRESSRALVVAMAVAAYAAAAVFIAVIVAVAHAPVVSVVP